MTIDQLFAMDKFVLTSGRGLHKQNVPFCGAAFEAFTRKLVDALSVEIQLDEDWLKIRPKLCDCKTSVSMRV
jgi:hypothetical protein